MKRRESDAFLQLDLNLLKVLIVLIEEGSVSAAAARLGLSQSAASHALRRLRQLLDDEVMIRTGGRMRPTPMSLRVMEFVGPALADIAMALREKTAFDPRTSTRSFTIRLSEYVSPTLLMPFCALLRRTAPGTRLSLLPIGAPGDEPVRPGEVQVRAERQRRSFTNDSSRHLFTDRFVVVMAEHGEDRAVPMTIERYVTLSHLKVTADAVGTNSIDQELERRGLKRNVVMSVSSWFEMRRVVLGTDLVAVVPRHWLADATFARGLAWHDLPIPNLLLSVELAWHPRDARDEGIGWMRDTLTQVARAASVDFAGK